MGKGQERKVGAQKVPNPGLALAKDLAARQRSMKFTPQQPPRAFQVGPTGQITLLDYGKIRLEPNEPVTFMLPEGGEYDVARKEWGFYATPSLNGRRIPTAAPESHAMTTHGSPLHPAQAAPNRSTPTAATTSKPRTSCSPSPMAWAAAMPATSRPR